MIEPERIFFAATLLGIAGLWLLLPRGTAPGRAAGALLTAIALGLGAAQLPLLGDWLSDGVFFVLAGVTVVSAIATITFRSPVYCALWFGLTLLGTAGLFLFTGAQFLAVATVVVYAGAILVTFLFVLMLAQPQGRTGYDRVSWEALAAASTGAVIVGVLSMAIASVFRGAEQLAAAPGAEQALAARILDPQHVARLGMELFGRHLVAVEVAGTLLLAALVGAAAILVHGRTERQTVQMTKDE